MRKTLLLLFFHFWLLSVFAQKNENGVELTAGVELRGLIPVSFFTMDDFQLIDSTGTRTANVSYKGGYGFGGVIRVKFTKLINLETGIYYTRRTYGYDLFDPSSDLDESVELRTVGYEIPIKGLFFVQMAERVFVDVAIGVSADFFASDVERRDPLYRVRTFRESWVKMAAIASLGVEYRTEEDGYFYVGGTFHQPFGDVYFTEVDFFPTSQNFRYSSDRGFMDGVYFSLDFRYFFPPKAPKKSKVRYVKPDWKNM